MPTKKKKFEGEGKGNEFLSASLHKCTVANSIYRRNYFKGGYILQGFTHSHTIAILLGVHMEAN